MGDISAPAQPGDTPECPCMPLDQAHSDSHGRTMGFWIEVAGIHGIHGTSPIGRTSVTMIATCHLVNAPSPISGFSSSPVTGGRDGGVRSYRKIISLESQ